MSKRTGARRFLRRVTSRLRVLARPLDGRRLVYEGRIYVRPAGRGVVLIDQQFQPDMDEWLEAWLDFDTGLLRANTAGGVRITVEYFGAADSDPEDWL